MKKTVALLDVAVGAVLILGWAGLLVFSLLRLFGVLEMDSETALTVTLALMPFAGGAGLAPQMIERAIPNLGLVVAAVIVWAITTPSLDRPAGWVTGIMEGVMDRIEKRALRA